MIEDGDREPPGGRLDGEGEGLAPLAPGAVSPSVPPAPHEGEGVASPQVADTLAVGADTLAVGADTLAVGADTLAVGAGAPPVVADPQPSTDATSDAPARPADPPPEATFQARPPEDLPIVASAAPEPAVEVTEPQAPSPAASIAPETSEPSSPEPAADPSPPSEPAPLQPVLASLATVAADPQPPVPTDAPLASLEIPAIAPASESVEPVPPEAPSPLPDVVPGGAAPPPESTPPAPASPSVAPPAPVLPGRTSGFVQFAGWRLAESLVTLGIVVLLVRLLLPTSTSPDWSGLGERLAVTGPLLLLALLLGAGLGWAIGALAIRLGGRPGAALASAAELGTSLSSLVLGLLSLLTLGGALAWFPPGGFVPWEQDLASALLSLVLPAASLGLPLALALAAELWRQARAGRDGRVIAAAAELGLGRGRAIAEIIMPQAWASVWTALVLPLSLLPPMALIIETAFYLPGLSRMLFGALAARDIGGLQLALIALAALVVLSRFVAELLRGATNPLLTDQR